jgi:MHS family alpha-ketoglutarate permease-like MFS transporter
LSALVVYPVFTGIGSTDSFSVALALTTFLLIIISAYTSISAVVKAELFPTHVRALGVALPYAAANALFGGTAEYAALWFKQAGAESGFYFYLASMATMACVVSLAMRDTKRKSMILDD